MSLEDLRELREAAEEAADLEVEEEREPEPPDKGGQDSFNSDDVLRDETYYIERKNTSVFDRHRQLIEHWEDPEYLCEIHREDPFNDDDIYRTDCAICMVF